MKFSSDRMTDPKIQEQKVGNFAKRSKRNELAEKYEETIRESCPYPISYDVSHGQPLNFSEYSYTELLNGFWISTQSLEINCRLIEAASKYEYINPNITADKIVGDKYELSTDLGKYSNVKRVCFLPGHNMLDVASVEIITRLVHEDDELLVKPHPITNEESLNLLGGRFGWNKLVPKDISGNALLKICDTVYTTSASEMALSGTLLGKEVINVSNFFNEGSGVYHPISRLLFQAHKKSVKHAQELFLRILSCPWSGIVVSGIDDVEDRINKFYATSLNYRQMYKPIASPRGLKKG